MWSFLAREANWTEIVTNTLALGFSLMAIVVIAYAVFFNPDILPTVGSVTSGITGVILGYYFNRDRLRRAQREVQAVQLERNIDRRRASASEEELEGLLETYRNAILLYEQLVSGQNPDAEE